MDRYSMAMLIPVMKKAAIKNKAAMGLDDGGGVEESDAISFLLVDPVYSGNAFPVENR